MIDLKDLEQVKGLQSNLRKALDGPPGKEVMRFLEGYCGWFDFHEVDRDRIMIAHGKRQVVAALKTLNSLTAEQIVQLAQQKEISNAG